MRLLDPFSFTRQLSTVPPLSSLLLIILQSTETSEERSIGILGRSGTSCRAPQNFGPKKGIRGHRYRTIKDTVGEKCRILPTYY